MAKRKSTSDSIIESSSTEPLKKLKSTPSMSSRTSIKLLKSLSRLNEVFPVLSTPKHSSKYLSELYNKAYTTIPASVKSRSPQSFTSQELVDVMEFKLTFGVNRPMLRGLIKKNEDKDVNRVTRKALEVLGAGRGSEEDLHSALDAICELKGVGPATGSLLLSLIYPDQVPFFSDEVSVEILGVGSRKDLKYNVKEYREVVRRIKDVQEGLKSDGGEEGKVLGLGEIERAIWIEKVLEASEA